MKPLSAESASPTSQRYGSAIVHQNGDVRVVAFALLAGQEVPAHRSPATVVVQVVRGRGVFRGEGSEVTLEPGGAAIFEPNEPHSIRALDEELHFLATIAPSPR